MEKHIKVAEVVTNGHGRLFAQVAENREYTCWGLTDQDIAQFTLRIYDEIRIEVVPQDRFCKVVGRYEPT
jgi:hypothetical protein